MTPADNPHIACADPNMSEALAYLSNATAAKEDACSALAAALLDQFSEKGILEMPVAELHELDQLRQFLCDVSALMASMSKLATEVHFKDHEWATILNSVMQYDLKVGLCDSKSFPTDHLEGRGTAGNLELF